MFLDKCTCYRVYEKTNKRETLFALLKPHPVVMKTNTSSAPLLFKRGRTETDCEAGTGFK